MLHIRTKISNCFFRSAGTSLTKPMSSSMSSAHAPGGLKVEHDASTKKFFIQLGNDQAELLYENIDNNTLDLYHTEVPPAFEGKGIAGALAKGAFDFVRSNNMKMKLTCEYLQHFYKKNETSELKKALV